MFLHSVLLLLILYYELLMYYHLPIIIYVTLPPGIGPIAVGN
jgi:hypothetical protein